APWLMDRLASEFAAKAALLSTPHSYWLAINGWITDRLSAPIMEGRVKLHSLSEQAWAVYASSYWGGIELRENWGMPPVMQGLSGEMAPPFTEFQQGIADKFSRLKRVLNDGGDHCLQVLPALMRKNIVHIMAYNAGVVSM